VDETSRNSLAVQVFGHSRIQLFDQYDSLKDWLTDCHQIAHWLKILDDQYLLLYRESNQEFMAETNFFLLHF